MSLTAAEEAQTRELLAQQAAILSLADSEAAIISNLGATDVSLSDLTAATTLNDADLMLVRQGTTDKSSAFGVIKSWINTATTTNDPTFAATGDMPASAGWVRGAMYTIATAAGFLIGLSPIGYIKLPSWLGGLMIQWGVVTSTAVANGSAAFSYTFPTACYSVVVTGLTSGEGNFGSIENFTAGSVTAAGWSGISTRVALTMYYVAIGR